MQASISVVILEVSDVPHSPLLASVVLLRRDKGEADLPAEVCYLVRFLQEF